MTSDPSNYDREYSPYGSYSLYQFEGSDVIPLLKNSMEYSFVFFMCLIKSELADLFFFLNGSLEQEVDTFTFDYTFEEHTDE